MSSSESSLDAWLADFNSDLTDSRQAVWDPGFDGERKVVISSLGPYRRLFLRPAKFIPRFFHSVYSLPIEEWNLSFKIMLYGGFCTMRAELNIHFQATFNYVQRNWEELPEINSHIKSNYNRLIKNIVDAELHNLKDSAWLQTGLTDVERGIETIINETLILKHIQCRTICSLNPGFEELSENSKLDSRFIRESVYLNVLQKNFDFREKQAQELFRQKEELDLQRLKDVNQENEIQQHKQALAAENTRRLLEDQQQQLIAQYAVEKRLYAEKIKHEKHLKAIEQDAEIQFNKDQQPKQQQIEQDMHNRKLEHEAILKERDLNAEIRAYENQQLKWHEAKKQELRLKQLELEAEIKEREAYQQDHQKLLEKLEAEKIRHQMRLKEMQLEAEQKELELRAEATKNKDDYLRREIEWLVLDKQRAELARAIREASGDMDNPERLQDKPN
ncbi:conserved hypothetical protein [Candidatus Methylobacter favarea]|uniref:Uncharacterized protein n=1 Tax=Candidatus Methylobacter favarea TaxID=2707345 RepID=A0A8S0YA12_9GAMM|nr:hypothetical protein [Candidatus Methylobacter favarea]CAA9890951.1 conserved hypothetical protein [Candidatus Methylobacter favarea]